jgi:hypothetical protein
MAHSICSKPNDENRAPPLTPNSEAGIQVVPDNVIFFQMSRHPVRNVGFHTGLIARLVPDVETKSLNISSYWM